MNSQPLRHVPCSMCLDLPTLRTMVGTAHITRSCHFPRFQVSETKPLLNLRVALSEILPIKPTDFVNADGENQEAEEDDGGESCRWLEEIGVPENSHMDEIEYLGPQIIE